MEKEQTRSKRPAGPKMVRRLHAIYRAHGIDGETKRQMLLELTDGRTDSTKGLTDREAVYLCGFLNGGAQGSRDAERDMLRKRRSGALRRMQRYGVDTTDWDRVDAFCLDPRIVGKRFYNLDAGELLDLIAKLERIIKRKEEA